MHDAPTPLRGHLLGGRYEIEEEIGHGGMSTIHRAHDRTLGRPVAVKVIRYPVDADHLRPELRERFRREAANAARIPPHPNVVRVYDFGTDAERDLDFIVMELLHGRDLKALLQERRPDLRTSVRILTETTRGLAAGHRAGIVHRDVKPANLFLVGEGEIESVRVLDFGIAKALEEEDDLTRIGGAVHTPAYTSPEQRVPGRALTAASDVYQLGLVAYEIFAGERPFTAEERERVDRGEPLELPVRGRWSSVPGALQAVVERALRPDPRDRYPDAAALAEALGSADGDDDHTLHIAPPEEETRLFPPAGQLPRDLTEAAPASVPPSPPRSRPESRRRLGVYAALGAVMAALLIWGAAEWAGGSDAPLTEATAEERELEETFAPLYVEAAEWLAEEAE